MIRCGVSLVSIFQRVGSDLSIDYFRIIHQHIPPTSQTYPLYLIHCTLVAKLALSIAERLGLSTASQQFVEEAAMLHDIGIVETNTPVVFCTGSLPYLHHLTEGRKLLEAANLSRHGQVAQTHAGISLTAQRLIEVDIALPLAQFLPQSIEEEIISFADLFYSKDVATLWRKRDVAEVRQAVAAIAPDNLDRLDEWIVKFATM